MASSSQPIGVFDSGVGGLTVLKALQSRLPAESYVYLGDTARLPYGTKTGETVVRYAIQAAEKLAEAGVKMLVIACNTASAHALPALQRHFPAIPVIGVIEPGAEAAVAATRTGRIAVLSTESTAKAGAYPAAIARLAPAMNVASVPCSLMVSLAEEGWLDGDIPLAIARRYLQPVFADETARPDTLVLGCTHFPLLQDAIAAAIGQPVTIIDSGATTAAYVARHLEAEGLAAKKNGTPTLRFMATDGQERFARVAVHFLEAPVTPEMVELIELSPLAAITP